jgi:CheY-like chemotaxis protein
MDVSMPRMNGLEATREIKAAPGGPRVVLTTFHASEAARAEARSAGADELIAKSEVTTKLRALIDGSTPAPPAPDAPDAPTGSPKKPKPGKGFLSQ